MGRKPTRKKQSKKVFLFVVEGCTEENYITILRQIYRKAADTENCTGGSAKSVMSRARKLIRKHKDDYSGYIIWFDEDRYEPEDANLKHSLESNLNINVKVCISEPCIENWLLAHFQEPLHVSRACDDCDRAIQVHIPHYDKADCPLLKRYINESNISEANKRFPSLSPIVSYFV